MGYPCGYPSTLVGFKTTVMFLLLFFKLISDMPLPTVQKFSKYCPFCLHGIWHQHEGYPEGDCSDDEDAAIKSGKLCHTSIKPQKLRERREEVVKYPTCPLWEFDKKPTQNPDLMEKVDSAHRDGPNVWAWDLSPPPVRKARAK